MPHVVTQSCCNDASCVYACPVNCIQPTPDDPAFALAEMLHIDPVTCVDCGACVSACPVQAIKPLSRLTEDELPFAAINRAYFDERPARPLLAPVAPPLVLRRRTAPLRVAVVGSGPAGMYAADEVLTIPGAEVDVYERLDQPYGLVRFGVSPDHRRTRGVTRQFDLIRRQGRLRLHLGAEVGRDISLEELLAGHHAVIHAVGAATDRRLVIEGADRPGVASATAFVGWYNGHPDHADRAFDLSHERVVVIGNGNVALDVAHILTADPDTLANTDIAPVALDALRRSRVSEVVVAGRRAPGDGAFTLPELLGLTSASGIDVVADPDALAVEPRASPKLDVLRGLTSPTGRRRVNLRFGLTAQRILPSGVEFDRGTGGRESISAGLVLTSIGYRGRPVAGLPFDDSTGTVPNDQGRVAGADLPGQYVAGWIKRGPSGFIGTNRLCARETVETLVDDFNAGRLTDPTALAASGAAASYR